MKTVVGITYTYDGDGKRVQKGAGKLYWYGLGADSIEETDGSGTASADFIFFGGKRTARLDLPGAVVHYYFANHLGSANVVTNSTGGIQDESDFYPFGGERVVTDSDPNQYKFTGKERDTESSFDYFGARFDSSSLGRFMTPDPIAGQRIDPQSLNAYSYVRNNPTILIDPTGMIVEWHDSEKTCKENETVCRTSRERAYLDSLKKMRESKDKKIRAEGEELTRDYERLEVIS